MINDMIERLLVNLIARLLAEMVKGAIEKARGTADQSNDPRA